MLTRSLAGRAVVLALALLVAVASSLAFAQSATPPLTVGSMPDAPAWIRSGDPLRLALSRPLAVEEGRVAVLIGDVDWSGLTDVVHTTVTVNPVGVGFPQGEFDVIVYLAAPGHQWQEIGRVPLRVLTPRGFEKSVVTPSLEAGLTGQAALARRPPVAPTDRDTFQDLTVRAALDTTLARNGWTSTTQAHVVGVNQRNQALRFGTLQDNAPLIDLSSYHLGVKNGVASVAAGHSVIGTHRLLQSNFASRGLVGSVRLGPAADITLSAVNGSSIIGIGNVLGIGDADHRVFSATLGLELMPARRGALRADVLLLNGSVQPVGHVNQGAVRDSEESRGVGFQLRAMDPGARLQFDAGIARSRFTNPLELLGSSNISIIPVRETTRDARYVDVSYALLRDARLGRTATASLTAAFRHSHVEPLYRSVALPLQADLEQHAVDVTTSLGGFTSQMTLGRSRDNLGGLDSILTTRTRQLLWSNALPLQTFAAASRKAAAWPTISYTLSRTEQVGDGLPAAGLFDSLSQVPDQLSLNHTLGAAWQGAVWRGGYSLNRSLQDNRQPGRENADLRNLVHVFNVGAMPSPRLDAGVEFAFEDADNIELVRSSLTRRISANLSLRPAARSSVVLILTRNLFEDNPRTESRRTTDLNVTFTQSVALLRRAPNRLSGQVFVRYARQTLYGLLLGSADPNETQFWSLNTGVSFRVF